VGLRDGGVLVVDRPNARLTEVSAGGVIRLQRRDATLADRVGRLPDGTLVAFAGVEGRPGAFVLDSTLLPRRQLPWAGWPDSAIGLGNQLRVATGVNGGVVAISIFTGRMMPVGPRGLDSGVDAINGRPLPPRVPIRGEDGVAVTSAPANTPVVTRAAAIVDELLFVVPGGSSADAGRWLDLYSLPGVKYLGSLRTDLNVLQIAGGSGWLAATSADPYPVIVRFRWDRTQLRQTIR
jgi:hypothetical protein